MVYGAGRHEGDSYHQPRALGVNFVFSQKPIADNVAPESIRNLAIHVEVAPKSIKNLARRIWLMILPLNITRNLARHVEVAPKSIRNLATSVYGS